LWLTNNRIRAIQGLDRLTRLQCVSQAGLSLVQTFNCRELYLGFNKIARIENLSRCTQLRVLWLFENQIPAIEGQAISADFK